MPTFFPPSLAEFGIGTAIAYSLYKPPAQGNQAQIAAIMALYRRAYPVIGFVVAVPGCALMPFLPVLIQDLPEIPHLHLIYLLFVLNSALSYFCAYKQSLIIADQLCCFYKKVHFFVKAVIFINKRPPCKTLPDKEM